MGHATKSPCLADKVDDQDDDDEEEMLKILRCDTVVSLFWTV